MYLIEIPYDGSHALIMCVIGVWRTIICNFNQVQVNTPWWWILCDPKHVGV